MLSRAVVRASTRSGIVTPRLLVSRSSAVGSLLRLAPSKFSRLPHPLLSTRVPSRWYSEAKDEPNSKAKAADAAKATETESKPQEASEGPSEVETLKKDLEAKNKEVVDLKDQYLRSVADYRNLQERTKREIQAARDFAIQKFARDLVSSLDTFEHAISSVPKSKLESPSSASSSSSSSASSSSSSSPSSTSSEGSSHEDLVNLHKGIQLTESVLLDTLKRHGLTRFDPAEQNEKFDPNLHEAVFQTPMEGKENGTVFHTQQKGFMLNGRVIRAAQVGVVQNQ